MSGLTAQQRVKRFALRAVTAALLLVALRFLGRQDPLGIIEWVVFPEHDAFGSTSLLIQSVNRLPDEDQADWPQGNLEVLLFRHTADTPQAVTFFLNDLSGGSPEPLLAGAANNAIISLRQNPVLSNRPVLMSLDIPPSTLFALGAATPEGERRTFGYTNLSVEKIIDMEGDLLLLTRNELRDWRMVYWAVVVIVGFVSATLPLFRTLLYSALEKDQGTG